MSVKEVALNGATATLVAGKDYLAAMAVGASVEQVTGYPGMVWVAMFIGAVMIRKTPAGAFSRAGIKRTIWRSLIAVGVAWAATGAVAKWLGLNEPEYLVLIAATLAGASETIVEWIRDPSRLLSVVRKGPTA